MNIDWSIAKILEEAPYGREFFALKGLPNNGADPAAARLTLKQALRYRKLDAERFLTEYALYLSDKREELSAGAAPEECTLWARIPCVVQLPIQNELNCFLQEQRREDLKYNVALVEFGKDWIDTLMDQARPAIVIGAGVEGMVQNKTLLEEYQAPAAGPLNRDFHGMEDPRGIFRLISGIPLVFVADEGQLAGRPTPESWADLVKPEWEKQLCYADDGHLLDSILLAYFWKSFGEEGLRQFRKNCLVGAHPSQMIKAGGLQERPAVFILPYIFAQIKAKEAGMRVIWPKEGAAILPLAVTICRDAGPGEHRLAEFLCGADCGRTLVRQGQFPSSCPQVENGLPGRLLWLGWDYLYRQDMIALIQRAKEVFLGGAR